jgi:hypothetical protein
MKGRRLLLLPAFVVLALAVPPIALWYYDGPREGRTPDGLYSVFMRHEGEVALELSTLPPSADPTISQIRNATALLNGALAAQSRFQDFQWTTTTGGYTVSNVTILGRPHARFYHVWNPEYMTDSVSTDPQRPEALVYYNPGMGRAKQLVGMMFSSRPGEHGAQPGGNLTRWHLHRVVEFCQDSDGIPKTAAARGMKGGCPAGMTNGPTPEMLHVWLVDNPFGAFSHQMALPREHHAGHDAGNVYAAFATRGLRFVESALGMSPTKSKAMRHTIVEQSAGDVDHEPALTHMPSENVTDSALTPSRTSKHAHSAPNESSESRDSTGHSH